MKDFIDLIKENARKHPERIAITESDRKTTYGDFLSLVNTISINLVKVKSKPRVVVDLEQGVNAYALIVAVLNVGGVYCPLNLEAPVERKLQIINEFNPDFIVGHESSNSLVFKKAKYVEINDLINSNGSELKIENYCEQDIVYVIYTSGSTGKPKGVKIDRKSLNKFLQWSISTYNLTKDDVWGQFSLLSFDLSIVDIFTCLCSGATLLAIKDKAAKWSPSSSIESNKITVWHSIPSIVDFMIERNKIKPIDISSLRLMSFCGEPLKKYHLDFLFSKNPTMSIYNTYGPTEGTLFCSWQKFEKDNYENFCKPTLSIGEPISGWNFQLSASKEDSELFEIVIYGDYIGKGYLGDLPNSKFFELEINGKRENAFQTGDLVKKMNGNLYFIGRSDRQIKLRGYRIEPDEIDFRITEFLDKPSVTILHKNYLYSFIESDKEFNELELKQFLQTKLEDYKIPKVFKRVEKFHRNANLKIDFEELKKVIL